MEEGSRVDFSDLATKKTYSSIQVVMEQLGVTREATQGPVLRYLPQRDRVVPTGPPCPASGTGGYTSNCPCRHCQIMEFEDKWNAYFLRIRTEFARARDAAHAEFFASLNGAGGATTGSSTTGGGTKR